MADTLAPPGAAPSIKIVPAAPSKPIKAGGVIKLGGTPAAPKAPDAPVTPPAVTPPPTDHQPSKNPERDKMNDRLRKLGNKEPDAPAPTPERPGDEPAIDPDAPEVPEGGDKPSTPPEVPTTPEGKKKVSPWKLVEDYKGRYAASEERALKAETELANIKKGQLPKEVQDRINAAEARVKEFEDEIRFVSYEKSPEFKEKFDAPYTKAWESTMNRLGRVVITEADGQTRYAKAEDVLDIINLPPDKAIELAEEKFGKLGNWVAERAEHIQELFSQRQQALEEGKKNGAQRETQMREQHERQFGELTTQIKTEWQKAQQAAMADEKNGKFFQPVEGDDEWNSRLEKGFAFVDEAMSLNPMNPKLSAEERATVIRKHNAMRNRAAAFSPMKHKITALESKVTELETELAQYKDTTPPVGGQRQTGSNGAPADPREAMMGRLRQKAV